MHLGAIVFPVRDVASRRREVRCEGRVVHTILQACILANEMVVAPCVYRRRVANGKYFLEIARECMGEGQRVQARVQRGSLGCGGHG